MLSKNNFIKNEYLYNCDCINKYNLKNIHKITKIENIILNFSVNNLIKATETINANEEDIIIKIKSFIFFFLLNSTIPFVNSNKLKIIKKQEKDGQSFYALKIILSNKKDINNFLFSFFVENWHNTLTDDIKFLEHKNFSNSNFKEKIVYNCVFPANIFSEMNNILKNLLGINSKDFLINLSFVFKKNIIIKENTNLIKNVPLFWISG